ncbi:MAG: hypothetical protein K2W96_18270 [Gemmataceae bacterium]|nr:hypothetical protein [Gemmataceae bacterium]
MAMLPDYENGIREKVFKDFFSIFEHWLFGLLRLWLTAYPQGLGARTLEFKTVRELGSIDTVTAHVVGKELHELAYDKPAEWFAYIEKRMKLGCPTAEEIERFSEAKASRDVLEHHRGYANALYIQKSGKLARFKDGERIEIDGPYFRAVFDLLLKLVADMGATAEGKT